MYFFFQFNGRTAHFVMTSFNGNRFTEFCEAHDGVVHARHRFRPQGETQVRHLGGQDPPVALRLVIPAELRANHHVSVYVLSGQYWKPYGVHSCCERQLQN